VVGGDDRPWALLRPSWAHAQRPGAGGGAGLLRHVVQAVDAAVLPRRLAAAFAARELDAVLACAAAHSLDSAGQEEGEEQGEWSAAMAAFAGALPAAAALERVQAAGAAVHLGRAAKLLAAARAASPAAAAAVAGWLDRRAADAAAGRDAAGLRTALLLQRRLCAGVDAYAAWVASLAGGGEQRGGHLQFLLQAVLLPLLPEDAPPHLPAQAAALAALPGPLSPALAALLQEYAEGAAQRGRAVREAAERAAGGGAVCPALRAPSEAHLARGEGLGRALLAEWGECGGRLRPATAQSLAAKAANAFQKGELINMLLPWMLTPTGDAEAAEARAALLQARPARRACCFSCMALRDGIKGSRECFFLFFSPTHSPRSSRSPQYLHGVLADAGSPLARHLGADTLGRYRAACALARLEGASLAEVAAQAAALLGQAAAGAAGAAAAAAPSPQPGGLLPTLDRLGRLVAAAVRSAGGDGGGSASSAALGEAGGRADAEAAVESIARRVVGVFGGCRHVAPELVPAALGVVEIVQRHPALHAPFLRQIEVAAAGGPEAACSAALAALLAAAAGAARGGGRPAFCWRAAAAEGGGGGALAAGTDWLRQMILRLPLDSADAMRSAAEFAAAHVAAAALFAQQTPVGEADAGPLGGPDQGADAWTVEQLEVPMCAPALQLLQWRELRLSTASSLLAADADDAGAPPPAKRPRTAPAPGAGDCAAAERAFADAGGAAAGAPLRLGAFISLEVRAAAGGGDEVPLWCRHAVAVECCRRFLGAAEEPHLRTEELNPPSLALLGGDQSALASEVAGAVVALPPGAAPAQHSALQALAGDVAACSAGAEPDKMLRLVEFVGALVPACAAARPLGVVSGAGAGGQPLRLEPLEGAAAEHLRGVLSGVAVAAWQAARLGAGGAGQLRALRAAVDAAFGGGAAPGGLRAALRRALGLGGAA
jgi:hypothetical protein